MSDPQQALINGAQLDAIFNVLLPFAEKNDMQVWIIHRSNYEHGPQEKGKWLAQLVKWDGNQLQHTPSLVFGQHEGATMCEALQGLYKAVTQ